MTPQEIKDKIENLEFWLTNHPEHPSRHLVLNDKRALELTLKNDENPGKNYGPDY